ncbi:MAG: hypothetical protein KatS3mg109_0825 [Pirellulaceae bacterium]|nr:MAG: hypothetical protein KatS3mg109_0825 [Pirellulaceae bacterium]
MAPMPRVANVYRRTLVFLRMEQTGISIVRVQEGKIVEGWSRADELGLLQQLGLLPATP